MNIPTKQLNSGFTIPVFGLGTWEMGGRKEHNPDNDDERDIRAIQKAIELGITHIDTAENYAEGYAEKLVGRAIEAKDRSELFLVSKVDSKKLAHDDVVSSCEASMKRMNTDYLDLYLIHAPNDAIPLTETLKAMDELVADGRVKNIGVSNFTTKRLVAAQQLTQNKIVVNQVYYNLAMREPEHEGLLKYCQENDVILEAYRPVEKGVIIDQKPAILVEMAERYHKTPAQVALNWLFSQPNVVTLSKSSSIGHLEENLGAIGWNLSNEDVEILRAEFPNQTQVPENLPLR